VAWLDEFTGDLVAIDTAPLIYFLEENPRYASIVNPLFEAVDRGRLNLTTSDRPGMMTTRKRVKVAPCLE
jgi:hypothetical protein